MIQCQNLGTSSRTPVQTIDKTINTVNRCEEVRKKDYVEREHEMSEVGGSLLSRMVKTMVKQMVDERFVEL